jgi:hypothetical protein
MAVKKTIVDEVAVTTAGCTPMVNIKGTAIIPPPVIAKVSHRNQKVATQIHPNIAMHLPIPNIPAHKPEQIKKKGYTTEFRGSHFMSP